MLEDLGACLKHLNVEGAGNGLEHILNSRSMFVAEVEDAARWTIKALGKGAADLLQVRCPKRALHYLALHSLSSPTLPVTALHSRSSRCRCPKRARMYYYYLEDY